MKKTIGILVCLMTVLICVSALADVAVNKSNFPDAAFRKYVKTFDTNKNGSLSKSEIKKVTCIDVSESGITDLTGVEHFTAVTQVICWSNRLTKLDLSKNTALTDLDCQDNQLTELIVSGNTRLTTLSCNDNRLTALDVSGNPALSMLWCAGNELTALDIGGNPELSSLQCGNNHLTYLDVSRNSELTGLSCNDNLLTVLDVSGNKDLYSLDLSGNRLTSLDLSGNTTLTDLNCRSNMLTALDVSGTALTRLDCRGNRLERLDITGCEPLSRLVTEAAPETGEDGSRAWRRTYEWGVTYEYLYVDSSVDLITDGNARRPALGMTIRGFIDRYNAVPAPSGAPYQTLGEPLKWTKYGEYQVAWFYPDGDPKVILLLLTLDTSPAPSVSMGLDRIDICINDPDCFAALIGVTARCADLFAEEQAGYSVPEYAAADLIRYYYENGLKTNGLTAQRPLGSAEGYFLSFTYYASTKEYYFRIFPQAQ